MITRDGHRVDALGKPVVEGRWARLRLAPRGTLASIASGEIDWPATEKFNAPPPPPVVTAPAPAPEPVPSAPGRSLEMTIIGVRRSVTTAPPAGPPRGTVDPRETIDLLAALNREMANLRRFHERLSQSKEGIEREIASLQVRGRNAAPVSSIENYEQPSQRALDQARSRLQSVVEQLDTIERRMNEIRAQAIGVGGSLD